MTKSGDNNGSYITKSFVPGVISVSSMNGLFDLVVERASSVFIVSLVSEALNLINSSLNAKFEKYNNQGH